MPLSLKNCGSLGGDIEMVPTLQLLAQRHPDVDFIIIGRNSGEHPHDVGLPDNVFNPWRTWAPDIREHLNREKLNYPNLSVDDHIRVLYVLQEHTIPEFLKLDDMVMWLGQHGTTNTPLPSIKDRNVLTKPHDWSTLYGSYLLQGINTWRDHDPFSREEVLLNADVRNYVKYRDSRWPWLHPVLAQHTYTNSVKHERWIWGNQHFDDFKRQPELVMHLRSEENGQLWTSRVQNVYSRIEISALIPGTPFGDTVQFNHDFDRPNDFGIVVNETRREVNPAKARRTVLRDWVLPLKPNFIRGKWSAASLVELQVDITPVPQLEYVSLIQSARCTFTTPASGSGWATAKPWESFAAGVVCFFHPDYDDQNNILGDAPDELRSWLRVDSPAQLVERIRVTCNSKNLWHRITRLQREHFEAAVLEKRYLKLIEERLGLT